MADSLQSPQAESGQRQMAFCHECRDEWYTSDHGLICPDCGNAFAEIVSLHTSVASSLILPGYRLRPGGVSVPRHQLLTDSFPLQIENGNEPLEAATLEPFPFLRHHHHYHDHDHDHDHDDDPYSHFESMRTERDGRGMLEYSSGLLSDSHFVRTRYYSGPSDRYTSTSPYPREPERPMPSTERHHPGLEFVQFLENTMGRGPAREQLRRTPLLEAQAAVGWRIGGGPMIEAALGRPNKEEVVRMQSHTSS
ncbi:MAG: hypothetical protein M1839_002111 [Geoglossum umbratile]|nr:MAG: hypothetical protein M1839_002111 [Geoglossum umbratile]